MGDYTSQILPAVQNGTVFDPNIITSLNAAVTGLSNAGVTDVEAAFVNLTNHVQTWQTDFTYNFTVFESMFIGSNTFDVNSYFGSLTGAALSLAQQVQAALSPLNTPALEALGGQANALVTNETTTLNNALQALQDQAEAISLNTIVNSPIGNYILNQCAGPAVANAVAQRQDEVQAAVGFVYLDPSEPVSDDPSSYTDPSEADPLP